MLRTVKVIRSIQILLIFIGILVEARSDSIEPGISLITFGVGILGLAYQIILKQILISVWLKKRTKEIYKDTEDYRKDLDEIDRQQLEIYRQYSSNRTLLQQYGLYQEKQVQAYILRGTEIDPDWYLLKYSNARDKNCVALIKDQISVVHQAIDNVKQADSKMDQIRNQVYFDNPFRYSSRAKVGLDSIYNKIKSSYKNIWMLDEIVYPYLTFKYISPAARSVRECTAWVDTISKITGENSWGNEVDTQKYKLTYEDMYGDNKNKDNTEDSQYSDREYFAEAIERVKSYNREQDRQNDIDIQTVNVTYGNGKAVKSGLYSVSMKKQEEQQTETSKLVDNDEELEF